MSQSDDSLELSNGELTIFSTGKLDHCTARGRLRIEKKRYGATNNSRAAGNIARMLSSKSKVKSKPCWRQSALGNVGPNALSEQLKGSESFLTKFMVDNMSTGRFDHLLKS